ncbi:hypothetical protein AAV35_012190 [Salimicrobium jeotgali]|uniref:Uncharacterized protein n=1 Tax=Salimicrobium jeotgali TaxID=1230341 RepID=K2G9P2_9BACI|nr:hypothetical protein [Salimicrobium jeotgali]AKG05452.1 hypothetical protein AAV35_012190 [Salimicrobium jeotgali]EKE31082.1 hypothetical protein MJ3_10311 [Salimicrobium jeotgali]MBM7697359.1 hypothetical protein [Salimicrobium jeotgali]
MGLFFQKEKEEITKPMIIIRASIAILMASIFIFNLINGFGPASLKWIFILAAIGSVIDGIDKIFHKKPRKEYLLEFLFALLWFALGISFFYL